MALHGHSAPITCLALCGLEAKDSDLVLSGAADGTALLWSVRRLTPSYISDGLRRPTARRCPASVVRGHRGPVTACAVSDGLGLALTCSDGRAQLTATEGNVVLRVLRPPGSPAEGRGSSAAGASASPSAAEDDSGVDASVETAGVAAEKERNGVLLPPRPPAVSAVVPPQLPAARYTACALGETGYCVLASSQLVAPPPVAAGAGGSEAAAAVAAAAEPGALLHELEVYTVNGLLTARVSGLSGAVRCLSTAGRGELVVVGGDRLMLEVRTTASLAPVWSLDPTSWASIDTFSGGGGGVGRGTTTGMPRGGGREGGVTAEDLPAVECVELGPNPNAPVLVCVGTSDGSLLVQVGDG